MAKDAPTLKQCDEALQLLREAPPRAAIQEHRYWPWRRKVEAFLEKLDTA